MNILPKKRWHVRTKDNIARVLRDEKRAAEEEEKAIRRKTLAVSFLSNWFDEKCGFFKEQEARLNHLRAKRGDQIIQFQPSDSTAKPTEHVNLFQLEEQGVWIDLLMKNIDFEYLVKNKRCD